MAALFAGRLGGVALNLLFLPLYDQRLGPQLFGAVALVLSLQAFFLVFDFGFATLLGAEAAHARTRRDAMPEVAADWRLTERLLPLTGLVTGGLAALLLWAAGGTAGVFRPVDLLLTALLVTGMIQLNAGQAVLNACHRYKAGSFLSLAGTLGRGIAALAMLELMGAGFTVFLVSQIAVILVQMLAQSWIVRAELGKIADLRGRSLPLWLRLRPLMAYGLAGALLMQIDKPLAGFAFSLEAAGRWYLATTYALTPIAMLAGPLNQYFFPQVVARLSAPVALLQVGRMFQFSTVLLAAAPSVVLAWHAPLLVSLWLPHAAETAQIAALARPMVLAAAFGAMGYLPTAYLVGSGDRAWIAGLSWAMLLAVGAGLLLAARLEKLAGFAIVYSIYHVAGCLLLWRRMLRSWPSPAKRRALIWQCWIAPLALTVLPTAAALALLAASGLPGVAQIFAASATGGAAMLLVAWRWWLRYGVGPISD